MNVFPVRQRNRSFASSGSTKVVFCPRPLSARGWSVAHSAWFLWAARTCVLQRRCPHPACSRGRRCGQAGPWPAVCPLGASKVEHCSRPVRADGAQARAAASATNGQGQLTAATRNPHQMQTLDMAQHDHAFSREVKHCSFVHHHCSNRKSGACDVTTPERFALHHCVLEL